MAQVEAALERQARLEDEKEKLQEVEQRLTPSLPDHVSLLPFLSSSLSPPPSPAGALAGIGFSCLAWVCAGLPLLFLI